MREMHSAVYQQLEQMAAFERVHACKRKRVINELRTEKEHSKGFHFCCE